MGYDTGKIELKLRFRERNRGDVFVPNLHHLPLLLFNFRSAVELCRGRLPPTASVEPALHCLELGSE
jgi:hypothetical protein